MKALKIIFTVGIVLTTTLLSLAQAKDQESSNAEKFSAKAGTLIQKEFVPIGTVKGAKIELVHFTDLIGNIKQSALKFEYESYSKYGSSTKSAILDTDEVDGLIQSIKIIQDKIFPSTASNYTEITFKSRGGFEAGCFWSKEKWSTYLKLEKYDKDSYVFLNKEDFPTLLTLLETAKTKL